MKSKTFVIAQFTLIILIALNSGIFGTIYSNLVFLAAVILGVWSVLTMKFRVSIFPDAPKNRDTLITKGPYKFIRHPIYTSVLLATGAWILGNFNLLSLFLWIFLFLVLVFKSRFEEEQLIKVFPEYKEYINSTKALIPFIY